MRNLTVLLAVVAILAVTAQADALVYEGFETGTSKDYAADVTIVGKNPTVTGFKDAWVGYPAASPNLDFYTRTAGLSYSNLVTTDGSLEYVRSEDDVTDNPRVYRWFDYTYDSGDAWLSVLFSFHNDSDSVLANPLLNVELKNLGNAAWTTQLLVDHDAGVSLQLGGGSGPLFDLGTLAADTTHLLVLKAVDKSGSIYDDISVWINPGDLVTLGDADHTGIGIFRENGTDTVSPLKLLAIVADNPDDGESFKVDEVRIGTSQGDVTPIPEPATLTLLGLGGLGLLIRRRRRS